MRVPRGPRVAILKHDWISARPAGTSLVGIVHRRRSTRQRLAQAPGGHVSVKPIARVRGKLGSTERYYSRRLDPVLVLGRR